MKNYVFYELFFFSPALSKGIYLLTSFGIVLAEFFPLIVALQVAWIWALKRHPGFLAEWEKRLLSSQDKRHWTWLVIAVEEIDLCRRIRKIKEYLSFAEKK